MLAVVRMGESLQVAEASLHTISSLRYESCNATLEVPTLFDIHLQSPHRKVISAAMLVAPSSQ